MRGLLCFLFSCFIVFFTSLTSAHTFRKISVHQGLSQISATAIVQDELNRIWIGTRDGLNVYDGERIKTYRPEKGNRNALLGAHIMSMVSHAHHIWVSTHEGVSCLNLYTNSFEQYPMRGVNGVFLLKEQVYASTPNGLMRFDDSLSRFVQASELFKPAKAVTSLGYSPKDQTVWVGTHDGLYGVSSHGETRKVLEVNVSSLLVDSKQQVWVGTYNQGLYHLDGKGVFLDSFMSQENSFSLADNFVRALCEDDKGNVWAGTFRGISIIDRETKRIENVQSRNDDQSLSHNSIYCIFKDQEGTLWIGSYFGGVNYCNPRFEVFTHYKTKNDERTGTSYPVIGTMFEDEQRNIWIATEGGGIDYYDRKKGLFRYHYLTTKEKRQKPVNVKALYKPDANTLFVGTYLNGFGIFDIPSGAFRYYLPNPADPHAITSNVVNCIIPYRNRYLLGTHSGLVLYDHTTHHFAPFAPTKEMEELQGQVIYSLYEDSNGTLWVGTENEGLYAYRSNGELRVYRCDHTEGTIGANAINVVFEDHLFRLWIGTNGGGLNRYNPDEDNFVSYTSRKNGLGGDFVYGIQESRFGNLWVSTSKGLSRFDVENDKFYNYDNRSGLPISETNHGSLLLTADGQLFIGGVDGLVSVDETRLIVKPRKVNLYFTGLVVNNRRITANDGTGILAEEIPFVEKIVLKPSQNNLSLQFASSAYFLVQKMSYQYNLGGNDSEWIDLQDESGVSFANLSSGTYRLRVRAIDRVAEQPLAMSEMEVEILPPFYKSWTAMLIYLLLVLGIIYLGNTIYLSKIRLMDKIEAEKREKEKLEELNNLKLGFFTNISHEFRTPLTMISGTADLLLMEEKLPAKVGEKLKTIQNHSARLSRLITELLDFRKIQQGNLKLKVVENELGAYLTGIFNAFADYAQRYHIKFDVQRPGDPLLLWFDPLQMEKVFFNILSNAFKVVKEKHGIIKMTVNEFPDRVDVVVTDNGPGMSQQETLRVFDLFYQVESGDASLKSKGTGIGLTLVKSIVDAHQGNVQLVSKEGKGVSVVVSILRGAEHFDPSVLVREPGADYYKTSLAVLDERLGNGKATCTSHGEMPLHTLLVVDDDPDIRKLLLDVFQPTYKVLEASNGEDALVVALEKQPDVILSDVMMPLMSGTELCSKIKRNLNTSHIPVVLVTAKSEYEHVVEGLETGADEYISKPFDIQLLQLKVKNLIQNRINIHKRYSKEPGMAIVEITRNPVDQKLLEMARDIILKNIDNPAFDVNLFAQQMGLGRTRLFSKIKSLTGQTPNDYIMSVRLKKGAELLQGNEGLNVSEVAYTVGFSNPRYFSQCFRDYFGVSPSKFCKTPGDGLPEKDE